MNQVRVGLGVLVLRGDGRVLLGKRKGSLGEGEWALPGGHLEYKESFEECACRELEEETGITLPTTAPNFEHAVNTLFPNGKHYVTVFMKVDTPNDMKAYNKEPHKCEGWEWISWDALVDMGPLFEPLQKLVNSGYRPKVAE